MRGRRVEAPARSGPAAGGAFGAISPLPSWPLWSRRPFPARAWPRRPRASPFPGLRGPQLARALAHPSPTQSGVGGHGGLGGPCCSDPLREADSAPSSHLPGFEWGCLATSSREKAEATGPPPQRYNLAKEPVPGLGFLVYKVRRRKLF